MYPLESSLMEVKSFLRIVPKVWGKEYWIVNCKEYCGKLLYINKGAKSSYHYHPLKRESFFASRGTVIIKMQDNDYILTPTNKAITIEPFEAHSFYGETEAVLLEISTHHKDRDIVRLEESRG